MVKQAQKFTSPGIGCYQPPPLPAAAPLPPLRFPLVTGLLIGILIGILTGILITLAVHGWL